ncbi:MAG: hypothetical protein J5658_10295 [Prevotella sp.]|nr:hypothetical protein [Prevotella sp.]
MKKLFKYTYVALAGMMALALASCVDKYEYDGVGESDPGAFISADATQIKYAADDAQILNFVLQRTNPESAEDIALTCDNSKFQVPSSVNFAAGESKKTVSVPFSILGGTTEEVTISVAPQSATVYGVGEMKFTITRDFVWEYLGEGVYTAWLFGESWPQKVYRGEGTQLYKLTSCIAEGYDIEFELTEDGQHLAKPIATQETGYVHPSYGMISLTNGVDDDKNPLDIVREDNIIYLPMNYIVSAGSFGTNYDSIELPE